MHDHPGSYPRFARRTPLHPPILLMAAIALVISLFDPRVAPADPGDLVWQFQGIENVECVGWIEDQDGDTVPDALVETYDSGAVGDHIYCLHGGGSSPPTVIWSDRPPGGPSSSGGYGDKCLNSSPDLDGDRRPDVLLGTAWGGRTAYGMKGTTGGVIWAFDTYLETESGWVYEIQAFPDMDGDRFPEALFCCGSDNNSGYLVDGTTGSPFWKFTAYDALGAAVPISDVNGDGTPDAVFGGIDNDNRVHCIKGSSSGSGFEIWFHNSGSSCWCLDTIEDLTGDGIPEVLAGTWGAGVLCLRGDTGALYWDYPMGSYVMRVKTLDDVDGDGIQDIAVASWDNSARVISGVDGGLVWLSRTGTTNGGDVWAIDRLPDVTGDGVNDVVAGSFDYKVWAFDGVDGDTLWTYHTGKRLLSVRGVPDMTGDGIAEVLAGTQMLSGNGGKAYLIEAGPNFPTTVDDRVTIEVRQYPGALELSWSVPATRQGASFNLYRLEEGPACGPALRKERVRRSLAAGELGSMEAARELLSADCTRPLLLNTEPMTADAPRMKYVDRRVSPDKVYYYELTTLTKGGGELVVAETTASLGRSAPTAPLVRVFPNPSTPNVTILLRQARDEGQVTVAIYDMTGRRVCLRHRGSLASGEHRYLWDGCDEKGVPRPSGIYSVRVTTTHGVETAKIALLR